MACVYSHRMTGRVSVGSSAMRMIWLTRAYIGHTMSVARVRLPPPSYWMGRESSRSRIKPAMARCAAEFLVLGFFSSAALSERGPTATRPHFFRPPSLCPPPHTHPAHSPPRCRATK